MAVTPEVLQNALQAVVDPNTGKPLAAGKSLQNLQIDGADVAFDIELGYPAKSQHAALRKALVEAARTVPGVGNVSVNFKLSVLSHAVQRGVQLMLARKPVDHRLQLPFGDQGMHSIGMEVNSAIASVGWHVRQRNGPLGINILVDFSSGDRADDQEMDG